MLFIGLSNLVAAPPFTREVPDMLLLRNVFVLCGSWYMTGYCGAMSLCREGGRLLLRDEGWLGSANKPLTELFLSSTGECMSVPSPQAESVGRGAVWRSSLVYT